MKHWFPILILVAARPALAEPDARALFETHIRPVLAEHCVECHGPKEQRGGLRLDTREHLLAGGEDGAVVQPGKPDESLLIRAVRHQTDRPMPDKRPRLSDEAVGALAEWVRAGLPWPDAQVIHPVEIAEKARRHWAYQPVRNPPPPVVPPSAGARNAIDAFLHADQERAGVPPSPPLQDRRVFLRRAAYVLTGLPPTEAEYGAAETASEPAFTVWADRVVDQYLASPHFGEKWGRLWLDVARYADNKGYVFQENRDYPYAYTYRDWVVRAFNDDLPFDAFITRQIAADRLNLPPPEQAALGFLTLGRRFINNAQLIIDDRIDVVSRGLMGVTMGCCRCHDHKSDPFTMKDYYGLYGVFASCREPDDKPLIGPMDDSPGGKAFAESLRAKANEIHDYVAGKQPDYKRPDNPLDFDEHRLAKLPKPERDHVREIMNQMTKMEVESPHAPPRAMVLVDKEHPVKQRILLRGSVDRPGEETDRAFPAFLRRADQPAFTDGSGRLELAREITRADNPLTDRVWVNRVWAQMMGRGLVENMSDFGLQTPPPSHPELLDWLVSAFRAHGRSTKWLIREIAQSAAWRRSSEASPRSLEIDPENRHYARFTRRRLDFEGFRDAVMMASGRLQPELGGRPRKIEEAEDTRRTLYAYVDRQNLPTLFRTFDFANPDVHAPKRFQTTTAPQALFALNSPFMIDQSLALAERVNGDASTSVAARVERLNRHVLGRAPTKDEAEMQVAFLASARTTSPAESPWSYGYGPVPQPGKNLVFHPLPLHVGGQWQASARMPDPRLHYVALHRTGGHPGVDAEHAVIRRWTAPADTWVRISGELRRKTNQGDSVRARVWSSRSGLVAEWKAEKNQKIATPCGPFEVRQGDTVDFIVDPDGAHDFDDFFWAPVIQEELFLTWSARDEFPAPGKTSAWSHGYGPLAADGHTIQFTPLPYFAEKPRQWRIGEAFPDPGLGYVYWHAEGGHPGRDAAHAAVRVWTAPKAGVVDIRATLSRTGGCEGRIWGRIVHSRNGLLGDWKVGGKDKVATEVTAVEVRKGDTLAFHLDPDGADTCDGFTWSPDIRMKGPTPRAWDAAKDFQGADPAPLAQLAQVLLMSNEFIFID